MADRTLLRVARECEEVATGLQAFKLALPRESTYITSIVSKLYEISATLSRLDAASQHPRFEPSSFRVKPDLLNVVVSLRYTIKITLDAFGRTKNVSCRRSWEDLMHRMTRTEGASYHERLDWYRGLLACCVDVLREQAAPNQYAFSAKIAELIELQGLRRPSVDYNNAYRNVETPISPSQDSNDPRPAYPWAPEVPLHSPTFSASSGNTFESSQTSYSNGYRPDSPPVHWAKQVFNGTYPMSPFRRGCASNDLTRCEGTTALPDALERLQHDGFTRALELQFEDGSRWVRFYHRASDDRARILFIASKTTMYCEPLTRLKAIRSQSCIMLCYARSERGETRYRLWANLNFATFERMALFYSTFVAMKRQDPGDDIDDALLEVDELREDKYFGGTIRHNNMHHALKIYCDRTSGVIRLEASPSRGPMAGVPLWTAFISSYREKNDQDWAEHAGGSVVSLAAFNPPPYIFLHGYTPLRSGDEWLLDFEKTKGQY